MIVSFGIGITVAVYCTRSKLLAWIVCIGFVIVATDLLPFSYEAFIYYREFNVYLYGAIKVGPFP